MHIEFVGAGAELDGELNDFGSREGGVMKKGGDYYDGRDRTVSPGGWVLGAVMARNYARRVFSFSNQNFSPRAVIWVLLMIPLIMLAGCNPELFEKPGRGDARKVNKPQPPSIQPLSQPAVEKGAAKDLRKIAIWDLMPREVKPTYAQELTSILASEIAKNKKYEVYTQDNVRTLAGWTEERMKLGCTSTQCLTALGQMDIAKLISGSVGKIGNRYSISLNLFDTQNARAENMISEFCSSEDELIELIQRAVLKLFKSDN